MFQFRYAVLYFENFCDNVKLVIFVQMVLCSLPITNFVAISGLLQMIDKVNTFLFLFLHLLLGMGYSV